MCMYIYYTETFYCLAQGMSPSDIGITVIGGIHWTAVLCGPGHRLLLKHQVFEGDSFIILNHFSNWRKISVDCIGVPKWSLSILRTLPYDQFCFAATMQLIRLQILCFLEALHQEIKMQKKKMQAALFWALIILNPFPAVDQRFLKPILWAVFELSTW